MSGVLPGVDDLGSNRWALGRTSRSLEKPIGLGIGIHVGFSVVSARVAVLQFLGDTGNVAAKLQAASKLLNCTLVASEAAGADWATPSLT
jgi:class 3 adenylate cyclase